MNDYICCKKMPDFLFIKNEPESGKCQICKLFNHFYKYDSKIIKYFCKDEYCLFSSSFKYSTKQLPIKHEEQTASTRDSIDCCFIFRL